MCKPTFEPDRKLLRSFDFGSPLSYLLPLQNSKLPPTGTGSHWKLALSKVFCRKDFVWERAVLSGSQFWMQPEASAGRQLGRACAHPALCVIKCKKILDSRIDADSYPKIHDYRDSWPTALIVDILHKCLAHKNVSSHFSRSKILHLIARSTHESWTCAQTFFRQPSWSQNILLFDSLD
jgi:hypothetical protein